ncbi:MAG TPA: hypothetical protein VHW65_10615 [Gemmatimonadales bacterium]|nr:hypothetical protein [Gemmatimonadales bacterium]
MMRVHLISVACLCALLAPRPARAQSVVDQARRAVQNAANSGRKAITDEANRQVSGAVQDAATANVADGTFSAVLTPWSTDGSKQVPLARYSGAAFVITTAAGQQVMLCDTKGLPAWQSSFTISKAAPATAAAAPAGRGASGGRGGATGPAKTPATAGGGDSSSAKAADAGAKAPSAGAIEYRFPSTTVTLAFPTTGAQAGKPGRGTLSIANVSEAVLVGEGRIRFLQATIPGEKGPQVVDYGVAFKARVLAAGDSPVGCTVPGSKSPTTTASSGRAASVSPAAPPPSAPAGGTLPAARPAGPVFAEGDVLIPKIDNVKLLAAAIDTAKVSATLKATDQLVYLGDEDNGYVHVQGSAGEGWVRKALLNKKP